MGPRGPRGKRKGTFLFSGHRTGFSSFTAMYSYSVRFPSHPAPSSICFCPHVFSLVTVSRRRGTITATPSLYPTPWHEQQRQPLLGPPASGSSGTRQRAPRRGWRSGLRRGSLRTLRLRKHVLEEFSGFGEWGLTPTSTGDSCPTLHLTETPLQGLSCVSPETNGALFILTPLSSGCSFDKVLGRSPWAPLL